MHRTLRKLALAAGVPLFPATSGSVQLLAAALKAANYRSAWMEPGRHAWDRPNVLPSWTSRPWFTHPAAAPAARAMAAT